MSKTLRVSSTHAEHLGDGRMAEPGEVLHDVDESDPHNKVLLQEGRLVRVAEAPSAADRASDAAKEKATELGVDLDSVVGTGANGNIKVSDVEAAAETGEEDDSDAS